MAEEDKAAETTEAAPKATGKVKLFWKWNVGEPKSKRSFFGLECTADKTGAFYVTTDAKRAKIEIDRVRPARTFQKA